MKSKVFSVLLRRPSAAGDYSCADGEIESLEGLRMVSGQSDLSDSSDQSDLSDLSDSSDLRCPFTGRREVALPEPPAVEFSLERGVLPGWHSHPETFPSRAMESAGKQSSDWGRQALRLLDDLKREASDSNLFVQPFFAIAALRLPDGNRILPSPPVLLTPNTSSPLVAGDSDLSLSTMTMRAVAAICRLRAKVTLPSSEEWKEVATHLDILVSAPISLFSGDKITGLHNAVSDNRSHSAGTDGQEREHTLLDEAIAQSWRPEPVGNALFTKQLLSTSRFFLVSETATADLGNDSGFRTVDFNCGGLTAALQGEAYIPDYAHHSGVSAATSSVFSGRDTLCGLTLALPRVCPLPTLRQHTGSALPSDAATVAAEVRVVKKGDVLRATRSMGDTLEIGAGAFPRWLFYPDPDAVGMTLATTGGTYSVKLHPHPVLHGACWWCGAYANNSFDEMGVTASGTTLLPDAPQSETRGSYALPHAIWRAAKGPPLFFPDSLLMRLDVERVVGVCRAFRSSGLVATTSPTAYAFTSEGVFLLKEMDDGTLRDAGLICTYVLADPASVNIDGRAVTFLTTGGLTIEIEGTAVRDISTGDSKKNKADTSQVIIRATDGVATGTFTTRPLKLGDPETLKRIGAVSLRGNFDPGSAVIELHGSGDLRHWRLIARSARVIHGLWAPSSRFLKVRATLSLAPGDTVEAIILTIRNNQK